MSEIEMLESVEYKLDFSEDLYHAYLSIKKTDSAGTISVPAIMDVLKKNNVVYGLNHGIIGMLVRNGQDVDRVEVATGDSHIDGKDSEIEYKFDVASSKPKINEDGSIDFKNIDTFVKVKEGELLAVKTPPSREKNGINVFGKIVIAKKGKLKNFRFGKNVVQSADSTKLYSAKNGSVELSGERISVLDVLEIRDDIGPKTGNVSFSGKIIVHGNVLTGYKVEAQGDVVINGTIEGANVSCDGNLIVNYGIQGQGIAKIDVKGDVIAKFINNAHLTCGGSIETGAIVHSMVRANGSVVLSNGKALIVGGNVYAKWEIKAKQIGTEIGAKTTISVGMTSEYLIKRSQVRRDIAVLEDQIAKLTKLEALLKGSVPSKVENAGEQLIKVSLALTQNQEKYEVLQTQLQALEQEIKQLKKAFVRSDLIYNGVVIMIDEVVYNVLETMYRSDIKMTMGEIYITNY